MCNELIDAFTQRASVHASAARKRKEKENISRTFLCLSRTTSLANISRQHDYNRSLLRIVDRFVYRRADILTSSGYLAKNSGDAFLPSQLCPEFPDKHLAFRYVLRAVNLPNILARYRGFVVCYHAGNFNVRCSLAQEYLLGAFSNRRQSRQNNTLTIFTVAPIMSRIQGLTH